MSKIPARQLKTGTPSTIGTANSAGSSDSTVCADHVHAHGSQTDPSLHAAAVAGVSAGFITAANQQKLDAIGSSLVMSGNPYIDPPAVPNSFDDEFESGSPDLAVRGYIVKSSAGVTMTRSGNVDPWNVTGPAANTYWSTIVGSQILIQPPVGTQMYVMRAVTLAAGDTYFARMGASTRLDATTNGNFLECGLYANASGVPDSNNRIYSASYNDSSGGVRNDLQRTAAGAYAGASKTVGGGTIGDIRGVRWVSGTAYQIFMTNSGAGESTFVYPSGAINGSSVAWFAVSLASQSLYNGTEPLIFSLDFVRKVTGTSWIAQAPRVIPSSTALAPPSGNPYIDPPIVAGAYDDEFDGSSPDLAIRGYVVKNASNVVMTRIGDIVPWESTSAGLTATTYRSTIIGSQLHLQIMCGASMNIYKPVSLAAGSGAMFWARMGMAGYSSGSSAATSYLGVDLCYSTGGNPDTNNRVFSQMHSEGSSGNWVTEMGNLIGGSLTNNFRASNNAGPDLFGVKLYAGSSDWRLFFGDSATGGTSSVNVSSTLATSMAYVRMYIGQSGTTGFPNNVTSQVFTVDFIRSASGASAWIGQTPKPMSVLAGGGSSPWTAVPQVTSYCDEFTGDTSATYSFYNRTDAVAMTRVGDVDPYGGGSLANNQYRSTCYGSWLMVQYPPNKDCLMYKALSVANGLVTARFSGRPYSNAGSQNNPYVGLFCAASSGGVPDIQNNSSEVGITTKTAAGANVLTFQVVGGATTDDSNLASAYANSEMDCFAQRFSGTTRSSWAYSSLNGQTNNAPARTFSPTVAFVGFRFLTGTGTNATDQVLCVDFLRIQPNTAWLYNGQPGETGTLLSGAAGGDLAYSYPNPKVRAITETSGPTQLVFGAIPDGQGFLRSGGTVIGFSPLQLASTNPVAIGTAAVLGVATTAAKADHGHAHGSQTDGTLHAVATSSVAGFQSASDKVAADAVAAIYKPACRVASTTNITNFHIAGNMPSVVDGVTLAVGDRVLYKDASGGGEWRHGIWVVQTVGTGINGTWVRSAESDVNGDLVTGSFTYVAEGTAQSRTWWQLTTTGAINIGTTLQTWAPLCGANDKTKLDGIEAGAQVTSFGRVQTALAAASADVAFNAKKLTGVADPAAAQDAATKNYADTQVVTAARVQTAFEAITGAVNAAGITMAADLWLDGHAIHNVPVPSFSDWATPRFYVDAIVTATRVQTALAAATADVSVNAKKLTNVLDPTAAQDAATKSYVDALAQGLDVKASCRLVATANVALTGAVVIDGVTTAADRVLLTAQTTASQNGIYLTNAGGAWTRATDADTSAKVTGGLFTFITEGSTYADSGWVLTSNDPITLGSTSLAFSQFSGAGQIVAGAGLTKTGNQLDVVANADGSIVVNADDIKVGILATDAQHGNRGGGALHANATTSIAGFLSAADKARLDIGALAFASGATTPAVGQWTDLVGTVTLPSGAATGSVVGVMVYSYSAGFGRVINKSADSTVIVTPDGGSGVSSLPDPQRGFYTFRKYASNWHLELTAPATTGLAGVMTAVDKAKLDSLRLQVKWVSFQANIALSGVATGAAAGERILVTAQTTASQNGVYVLAAGSWTRATDMDASAELTQGMKIQVTGGDYSIASDPTNDYAGAEFVLKTAGPYTLGTTALAFKLVNMTGGIAFTAPLTIDYDEVPEVDLMITSDGSLIVNGTSQLEVGVLATDAQHGDRGGGTLHADATTSVSGFMSANDRTMLGRVPRVNQCRLSGESGSPIMTADNASISTIYLLPYTGDMIYLMVTALGRWAPFNIPASGISLALSGMTTGRPYDVFCVAPSGLSGTPTLEILAWTSTTARATALTDQGGFYTKLTDGTRRYVGTIYARSATTISWCVGYNTVNAKCDIWNADNRVPYCFTNNTTWVGSISTPTLKTWFYPAGQNAHKFEFIQGRVTGLQYNAEFTIGVNSVGTANQGFVGIGLNGNPQNGQTSRGITASGEVTPVRHAQNAVAPLGFNTLHFMLYGTTTAVLFYTTDNNGGATVSYEHPCFTRWEY